MNDGKLKFTHEMMEALRQRVIAYRENNLRGGKPITWKELAGMIGKGESTVQAWAKGTYPGDNQALAEDIAKWFETAEAQELFSQVSWTPGFQPTTTARQIEAHLTYAKLGNLIIIVGDPGVGKTFALKEFERSRSNVWVLTAAPSRKSYNAFMTHLLDTIGVSSPSRTGYQLSERIRAVLKSRDKPLLIIDEAQHLGEGVLEELRSFHDETGCGIAFCGNRESTRTIDGNRVAQFAQRSSRISKRAVFGLPQGHDVKLLLEAWGVVDATEVAFLERIAKRPGGGALRQMTKVLELASLMASHARKKRDFSDLKEAAEELQAGMAA